MRVLIVLAVAALTGCAGSEGGAGGENFAGGRTVVTAAVVPEVTPPAVPADAKPGDVVATKPSEEKLAVPTYDVLFVAEPLNPSKTMILPGEYGTTGFCFSILWKDPNHPAMQQIAVEKLGDADMKFVKNVRLLSGTADVRNEAMYKVVRNVENKTFTFDFLWAAWRPDDFGREPKLYCMEFDVDPTIPVGSTIGFRLIAAQMHDIGKTAGGVVEGPKFVVRKFDGIGLPSITAATSSNITMYEMDTLTTAALFKAKCPLEDRQEYCRLEEVRITGTGVYNVSLIAAGMYYSATWEPCDANSCYLVQPGYVQLPGQTTTYKVAVSAYQKEIYLNAELVWRVGQYRLGTRVPISLACGTIVSDERAQACKG